MFRSLAQRMDELLLQPRGIALWSCIKVSDPPDLGLLKEFSTLGEPKPSDSVTQALDPPASTTLQPAQHLPKVSSTKGRCYALDLPHSRGSHSLAITKIFLYDDCDSPSSNGRYFLSSVSFPTVEDLHFDLTIFLGCCASFSSLSATNGLAQMIFGDQRGSQGLWMVGTLTTQWGKCSLIKDVLGNVP
ncbi:hypothetical protein Sjap_011006 [Stephania japonica]|uniref:Uncharacterized protein n=1 Tax=Stephania japonica TaxID=461633 RepID=A0AAP0JAR0_9MAGN